jgi:hypothetical protein
MSLVIHTQNPSTISAELNNTEAEIIDGLFNVQDYKSCTVIAQPEDKQSGNMNIPGHDYLKANDHSSVRKSITHIPKPGHLAGISIFDYVELKNYIYGVNGRY